MTGNLKENPLTIDGAGALDTARTAEADYPIAEINKWLAARFEEGQEATYVCQIEVAGQQLLGFLKWDQTCPDIKIPLGWGEKRREYGLGYMYVPGDLSDKKWEEIEQLAQANKRFFGGKRNPLDTWPKLGLVKETDYGQLRCWTHHPTRPYDNEYIRLFWLVPPGYGGQTWDRAYQLSGLREEDLQRGEPDGYRKYNLTVGYLGDAMAAIEFAKIVEKQEGFGWKITPIPLKEE